MTDSGNGLQSSNGHYYNGRQNNHAHSQGQHSGNGENGSDLDVKHLIGLLHRYKWWFAGITIGVTLFAFLLTRIVQPIYESSGSMLIQQEQGQTVLNGGSALSSMMSSSFGVGGGSILANELHMLQSRTLAFEVAGHIHAREEMPNGEIFPILYTDYPDDPTKASVYQVAMRLMRDLAVGQVSQQADIIQLFFSSPSPVEAKTVIDTVIETYQQISSERKRTRASAALAFLQRERENIEERLAESEEELREYMDSSNLIQIDGQTEALITRIAELESRKQEVRVEKVAVDTSIASYRAQLNEIRPGLVEQFALDVSRQLESAQVRLAELRTERALILQRNPALLENSEEEPQLAQLNREIQAVQNEIEEITSQLLTADDSDIYIGFLNNEDGGVTERIVELRRNLIELRIQESQLNAQEQVINERLEQENRFFEDLPRNMLALARLKREVEINEELFKAIAAKQQETELWEQTQFSNGQVMEEPYIPRNASFPNVPMFLILGFLGGAALSLGVVALKETTNQTIEGTEKLKELGYPVLSVLPDYKPHVTKKHNGREQVQLGGKSVSTRWTVLTDNVSPVSDGYRRLANNIEFADPDRTFHTIAVTSSRKSEGKSTVSANLAAAIAETGKRVLMVDLDLRRPKLHAITGEKRTPGMSDIVFEDISWRDAVKSTAAPGVDLITVGTEIPNPTSVMHSRKLKALMSEWREEYGQIILDTPPFGMITDSAPVIQRAADGIVLVARFKETDTAQLRETAESLEHIRARVIGTVLTAYKHSESRDYYTRSTDGSRYEAYAEA